MRCLKDCFLFFFSSRRRHTRFDCDWSSDVCSSDLDKPRRPIPLPGRWKRVSRGSRIATRAHTAPRSRSEERRVGKSVDLGGRRIIKKKKKKKSRNIIVHRYEKYNTRRKMLAAAYET